MIDRDSLAVRSRASAAGELRLNTWLSIALLVFLALAPVPAASNRPIFWVLSALVVALIGAFYAVALIRQHGSLRFSLTRIPVQAGLMALLMAYVVVQVLPLRALLGQAGLAWLLGPIPSPAISLAPGATVLVLLQFATYALTYFLTLQIALNRERVLWLTPAIFFIISAHAAYSLIALTQFGDPMLIVQKWAYQGVATGTFVNRNSFATFLAFGLVVGLALLLREVERALGQPAGMPRQRVSFNWSGALILGVCLLVVAAALLATQSRLGAFAAAIGCVAILVIFFARRRITGARTILVGLSTGLAIVTAGFVLYGGGLLERVGSTDVTTDVRPDLYAQVVEMIGQRPWLGYGGGTFEVAFPFFHRLPVSADLLWDKAHSTYLALWAELGVVAGSLPIIIVGLVGWRLLGVALRHTRDWSSSLAGFGVIVVACVHSVGDFSLEIEANALMFVAIIALGMAGATSVNKSRPAP